MCQLRMRWTVKYILICIYFYFMFYILQWNARGLVANGQEFKRFIDAFVEKPDVICVQESWLKPCLDFVIPGCESFRADQVNRVGGG